MRLNILLFQLLLALCSQLSAQNLTLQWKLEQAFLMPESATLDGAAQYIFVSNVNEYAKDGNGFISRVSLDGERLELRWLDGLDSPTGLAVFEGRLYFADFDQLVVADINTATISHRYPAPDSNPSLNDVAITSTGEVFVSGSSSNSIYKLEQDGLRVWLHDDETLLLANGLYVIDEFLVHGGKYWNVFELGSAARSNDFIPSTLALEDIDGITRSVCGNFLLTLINDSQLWQVNAQGDASPSAIEVLNGIDLHSQSDYLVVPQVGGDLSLYRQDAESCVE